MPEVVAGAEDTKLGLVPQLSDGYVLVKDVSKGGWAETAGIKALARISQINGVQVAGMSDADFKAALKQRPLRIRFEQKMFEVVLDDPAEKLGCGFSGVPPGSVTVSKVAPGSFAERHQVEPGYELVALNGTEMHSLAEGAFKEGLKSRPARLRFRVPQAQGDVPDGMMEVVLADADTKLGCGFAGVPPEPVVVGKITPGSFAERNKVQIGYSLVAVNGTEIKSLNADSFKEALKARPVRLRIQIPQEEEKVQTVEKVEKQENAATAIQALARGRAARKGTGLEAGLAGMQEANTFELTLQDAETKLGCGFAGVPPEPVDVGKITPGSFAERNNVQVGYSLVAVNGKDIKNLTSDTFKEALKARPVSLRIQVPQEEEKVQTVQKVEKQENAATAIQALARGRAARQASRPLEELEAAVAESDLRTFTVEAAVASLGLEFAGPKPVVSKVLAGGWGERSGILARSEIRSINGQPVVPAEFQAQLEQRPLKLSIAMARGSLHTEQTPSEKVGLADLAAVRAELAAKEKELALARRDLAAANQELKQLKSRALDSGAGQDVSQAEVAELRQKLQQREKDLDALRVQGDPGRGSVQQNASGDELARCMQELEETKQRLKESEEREHAPRPGTPESGKSVEIKASYWAEVELQALKEELGKKDQQLQKLRKDVAESYAKLKDDDGILRATVPAHFPELGFRLRDDEVSEVKVDGWAAAVGLKLGDRLMMIQNKPLAELRQEQFQEAWQRRPLELGFRRATRQQAQQLASRKIQAQWRGKSARNKSKKAQLEKQQAECEAQAFSVTLEASEEVGFFLETWPPAPKVLIKGVKKDSWAQRVGIKAGQQLLACQKEPLRSLERRTFRAQLQQRPLELKLCPALRADAERLAAARIQSGWRNQQPGAPSRAAAPAREVPASTAPEEPREALPPVAASTELWEEVKARDVELRRLRSELSHAEAAFETSIKEISQESSSSAVELASLKAQLAVEQSKAARLQGESSAKATSLGAKLAMEQRKAETLETRLIEAEVIHQEQLSEITDFLESRKELLGGAPLRLAANARPKELEELRARLAEEEARVGAAEKTLVSSWSEQRAMDLQWQAELQARDQRLEMAQKELAKAEWWASIATRAPGSQELMDLKDELTAAEDHALQLERRLAEAQDSKRLMQEAEALQAALNTEEARLLHVQVALTEAQIKNDLSMAAATQIQAEAAVEAVTREELQLLTEELEHRKVQLQQVKEREAAAIRMQAHARKQAAQKEAAKRRQEKAARAEKERAAVKMQARVRGNTARKEVADMKAARVTQATAVTKSHGGVKDEELRERLASALKKNFNEGELFKSLDQVNAVPWSEAKALKQEVKELTRHIQSAQAQGFIKPQAKSALRRAPTRDAGLEVRFRARSSELTQSLPQAEAPSANGPADEQKALREEVQEEQAHRQELEEELASMRLRLQADAEAMESEKAELRAELRQAQAKEKELQQDQVELRRELADQVGPAEEPKALPSTAPAPRAKALAAPTNSEEAELRRVLAEEQVKSKESERQNQKLIEEVKALAAATRSEEAELRQELQEQQAKFKESERQNQKLTEEALPASSTSIGEVDLRTELVEEQAKTRGLERTRDVAQELKEAPATAAPEKLEAELRTELGEEKAKILALEKKVRDMEEAGQGDELMDKAEKAINLNELSVKDTLLAQAKEEAHAKEEKHQAEKELLLSSMAQKDSELHDLRSEHALQDLQVQASETRMLKCQLEMQEDFSDELRKQLGEVREELSEAESMGWQPQNVRSRAAQGLKPAAQAPSSVSEALRHEQELAESLHQELREVETAAIATAEAAEARILQIEALDRRGRVALHMAESAAEKEAALKQDAIKAACEAEADVDTARREMAKLRHEVVEQNQAAYRESAVCDGLRRALMNSVEQEMAQEALHAGGAGLAEANPTRPRPTPAAGTAPFEQVPGENSPLSSPLTSPRAAGVALPPRASHVFASRLARQEDLRHHLMSPSEVNAWMEPSMISQPSLLSAAAKEAASLRKEAEQLRREVRHWRASRPARPEPAQPASPGPRTPSNQEASQGTSLSALQPAQEASRESEVKSPRHVPTLQEQPPPRPPPGMLAKGSKQ